MTTTKKLICLFACIVAMLVPNETKAEIQPTNILLLTAFPYTVPAGKVLVIKNVSASHTSSSATLEITIGNTYFFINRGTSMSLCSPIYAPENTTLSVNSGDIVGIFCLLVDPSDLYAALPSTIDNIAIEEMQVSVSVSTEVPRPAILQIHNSKDLIDWNTSYIPLSQHRTNPTSWQFSSTASLDSSEFYRAVLRAK